MEHEESFHHAKYSSFEGWTAGIEEKQLLKKMLKQVKQKSKKKIKQIKLSARNHNFIKTKINKQSEDRSQIKKEELGKKNSSGEEITLPLSIKQNEKNVNFYEGKDAKDMKTSNLDQQQVEKQEQEYKTDRNSNLCRLKKRIEQLERDDSIYGKLEHKIVFPQKIPKKKSENSPQEVKNGCNETVTQQINASVQNKQNQQHLPIQNDLQNSFQLDLIKVTSMNSKQLSNSQAYIINNTFKNTVNRKISLKEKQRNFIKKIHANSRYKSHGVIIPNTKISQKWSVSSFQQNNQVKKKGDIQNEQSGQSKEDASKIVLLNKFSIVYPLEIENRQQKTYESLHGLIAKRSQTNKKPIQKQSRRYTETSNCKIDNDRLFSPEANHTSKKSEVRNWDQHKKFTEKYKKSMLRNINNLSSSELNEKKTPKKQRRQMNKSQPLLAFNIDNANRSRRIAQAQVSKSKIEIQAKTLKKLSSAKDHHYQKIFNRNNQSQQEFSGLKYCQVELAQHFESSIKFKDKTQKLQKTKQNFNKQIMIFQKQVSDKIYRDRNPLMENKLHTKLVTLKNQMMEKEGDYEIVLV